jgi:hypothetical protein
LVLEDTLDLWPELSFSSSYGGWYTKIYDSLLITGAEEQHNLILSFEDITNDEKTATYILLF